MEVHALKTWFDQHAGLVELEDDVLGIVQQVKAIGQGRLHIFYNHQSDGFDLVERCLDNTDRLVFSVDALDQRLIERLHKADHWGSENPDQRHAFRPDDEDYASEVDRHNDALEAGLKEKSKDRLRQHGEELAWALEEDGRGVNASILVTKDVVDVDHSSGSRPGAGS